MQVTLVNNGNGGKPGCPSDQFFAAAGTSITNTEQVMVESKAESEPEAQVVAEKKTDLAERKTFQIDDKDVVFRNKAGAGLKECENCRKNQADFRFVAARTAIKIGKCHCGARFVQKETADTSRFDRLSIEDFKLILKLASDLESGAGLAKPSSKKPSASDFREANREGDQAKQDKLSKVYDEWMVWESSKEISKKAKSRILKAIKG